MITPVQTNAALANLLNYGANFRTAFLAIGNAAGLPMAGETSPDDLKAPYVGFHFILGEPSGSRRVVVGQNPKAHLHDAFNAELLFEAVTNRTATPVEHETLCAGVRLLMATIFQQPTSALPLYQLNRATPGRNTLLTDTTKRLDVTRMPWTIHFNVRPEAWPAGH